VFLSGCLACAFFFFLRSSASNANSVDKTAIGIIARDVSINVLGRRSLNIVSSLSLLQPLAKLNKFAQAVDLMLAASADEELPHVAQRGQDRCVSAQHYRSVQLDVCKSSICDGLTFWVLADTSEPGELAEYF
jgi:hypothetical protein